MKRKQKPKPVLMTQRRLRNYLKIVREHGQARNRNFGEKFSPADFAAGAGIILEFCGRMDMMPASWFFGLMLGGKNPFETDAGVQQPASTKLANALSRVTAPAPNMKASNHERREKSASGRRVSNQ